MNSALLRRRSLRVLGRILICTTALAGGVALASAAPRGRPHASRATSTAVRTARSVRPSAPAQTELIANAPQAVPDALLPARVVPHGFGEQFARGLTIRGGTPNRLILFTFDDGPDRSTTPALLDRLDAAGVHAVFFLSGQRIRGENQQQRDQQEIARDTVRRGHIVASHTVDHLPLPTLDTSVIVAQIEDNERIFQRVFGERPWLFRPPFGMHTNRTDALFQSRGYTIMFWNLGTGDYQVHDAEDVHTTWRRVFERRERENGDRGGVVLLHDTHAWSVAAFSLIFDDLMARNCKALTTGEELYDVVEDPSLFFVPRGGAPAGAEAAPAVLSPELLSERQARLRDTTQQRCSAVAAR